MKKIIILFLYLLNISAIGQEMYIWKNGVKIYSVRLTNDVKITFENSSIIPTEGLVAYYPFDGNADDQSDNSNNGTIFGASLTTDRFNNKNSAFKFNGTSNYLRIPNHHSLNFNSGQNYTIALWIFTSKLSENTVIGKYNSYSNRGGYFIAFSAKHGKPSFDGRDQLGYRHSGPASTNVKDGAWHLIVGMRNGSEWSVWVDGNKEAFVDAGNTTTVQNLDPLWIGGLADGTYPVGSFFEGKIDDIRIYNRALSNNEIQALLNENK